MKRFLVITAICVLALSGVAMAGTLQPWGSPTVGTSNPLNIGQTTAMGSTLVAVSFDRGTRSSIGMTFQSASVAISSPQRLDALVCVRFTTANASKAIWTSNTEAGEIGMFVRIYNSSGREVKAQDFRFTPGRWPGSEVERSGSIVGGARHFTVRTDEPVEADEYYVKLTFYARATEPDVVSCLTCFHPWNADLH
jgi:hypothetical protein